MRLLMMAALPPTTTPIRLRYEAEPESVLFVTPTNAQVLYQANAEALAEYQREQVEKARAGGGALGASGAVAAYLQLRYARCHRQYDAQL